MKRILFVTESLARGGMERMQVDYANALVNREYDVTIVTYSPNDALKKNLDKRVRLVYRPRNPLKLMRSLPYIHRFYRNDKWEKKASAKTLYKYYVGKEKYDVEIGFYRGPSIKIISGSKNKNSKKFAWVHTDFKLCDPKSITKFFNNIDEVKSAYSEFDKIICVSNEAKESFDEVIGLPDKTTGIYNMISVEKIRQKSQEECPVKKQKFTIVTVGRLIPDKGYDRLLASVKKLNEEGFDFDLWIIGGGRAENDLKSFAQENKLQNVYFAGMQENPYKYLKHGDLFVCSSKREGFSLSVAEALALGIPVISTECTGPTEILGDGEYGIIVENSEEGIYEGLKKVLENKDVLKLFEKKSLERCWNFDESNIMKQIVELVEN